MGIFNRIFGGNQKESQNDSITNEIDQLIFKANASAITCFNSLVDDFPKLKIIPELNLLKEFDKIVTIANVGIVMLQVSHYFNSKDTQKYILEINKGISRWDEASTKELIYFGRYINDLTNRNQINSIDDMSEAIGAFVFINLYENNSESIELEPLTNEVDLFFSLGSILTMTFSNYWN